jgi:hypothetical protein
MRKAVLLTALVIAAAAAIASAQEGPTVPITVGTAGCGTGPQFMIDCYAVPLTIGQNSGTAWINAQWNGGFILFRPPLQPQGYVTAAITGYRTIERDTEGRPTAGMFTYALPTPSTVTGQITLYYGYTREGRYTYQNITGGQGEQSSPGT